MILEDTSAHTFSLANVYSTCSSNSVDVDFVVDGDDDVGDTDDDE